MSRQWKKHPVAPDVASTAVGNVSSYISTNADSASARTELRVPQRVEDSSNQQQLGADGQLLFPASAVAEFLPVWRGPTLTKL